MNYAQHPYDPYAVYRAQGIDPSAFDGSGHHPQLRIWIVVVGLLSGTLYTLGITAFVAGLIINDHASSPGIMLGGWCALMIGAMFVYVKLGIALYWLHGAWKWVPMDQRFSKEGKRFSPGDVFMLLIPYYHFYWMFPINMSLCDVMERLRMTWVREHRADPPPRDTAMWAAICEFIPFANFFIAPLLWASYMRRIDVMHDEIMNAAAAAAGGRVG
jgi:hypothetical protein